jgi:hypothetical protein
VIDTFVLDDADARLVPDVEALGLETVVLDSMMRDRPGRARVAAEVLAAVAS